MNSNLQKWLLALATILLVSLLWTTRTEYAACDLDGCVAINRWTGTVHFRPAADQYVPADPAAVMVRARVDRGRSGARPPLSRHSAR